MFINISLKTNRLIKIAAIVQLFFMIASIAITLGKIVAGPFIFYLLTATVAIFNLLLFMYMIKALIFFAEKRAIVIAYIIYLILDIVRNINTLFMGRLSDYHYVIILGILVFLVTIYLFILTLMIKSPYISFAFKFFAYSTLILLLLRGVAAFVFPLLIDSFSLGPRYPFILRQIIDFLGILWLVMPISVILIARGANDYINMQIGGSPNSLSEIEETF